ncbi:hypothetical protein [Rhodoferax sp. U11-2br]|uniref:hypothetical protein n=1 Tax=Rhodoferax sp. U11-2br TaxID=2838878 RepID=UPI001BE7B575|nr:hypothetical protein [Rhodoferax sp. U11-2br]MBT3067498.1 hypothetical protein [Rhodoferax sp. U11-2br]
MKPPILHFPFTASDGIHECRVELDWLGSERYYVDDSLVLDQWSLLGKTATFTAHGVKIQVRTRLELRHSVMEVLLDEQVVINNLLADYNTEFSASLKKFWGAEKPMVLGSLRAKVGIWIVLFLAFFIFFKWLK